MKALLFFSLLLCYGVVNSQKRSKNLYEFKEICSIYKFEKSRNHLYVIDSLIVYKDKTFYKFNLEMNYDEIERNEVYGTYEFFKNKLTLEIKRCDSCIKSKIDSRIYYKVKKDHLTPLNNLNFTLTKIK